MLPCPDGAGVREQHRRPPTAEDWVALIGDYCKHCLLPGAERGEPGRGGARPGGVRGGPRGAVVDRVPADPGRDPGGRVAGGPGARPVGEQGHGGGGDPAGRVRRARRAAPRAGADRLRRGGRDRSRPRSPGCSTRARAGRCGRCGALLEDEVTAGLDPVLMTGQRVACGADTAAALAAWLGEAAPDLGVVTAGAADPTRGRDRQRERRLGAAPVRAAGHQVLHRRRDALPSSGRGHCSARDGTPRRST